MNRLELAEKLREIAYDVEQGKMGEGEVFERICEMLSADSGEIACTISSIAETQQSIAAIQQMTEMRVEDVEQALTKLEQRQSLRERFPSGSIVEVPKRDAMSYAPTPADLDTFRPIVIGASGPHPIVCGVPPIEQFFEFKSTLHALAADALENCQEFFVGDKAVTRQEAEAFLAGRQTYNLRCSFQKNAKGNTRIVAYFNA